MNPVEILLVEDNLDDAEMTINALRKKNLASAITHVEDGEEALEFLFAEGRFAGRSSIEQPKLILLDVKMPKLNGLEVLKIIKSDKRTSKIPVIMLTSSKEEPDIHEAYSLGANSYIVKPVTFDNFADIVSTVGFYWLLINQTSYDTL
jgi:two-component system response regulator